MLNLTLVKPQTNQRTGIITVSLIDDEGMTLFKKEFKEMDKAQRYWDRHRVKLNWEQEINEYKAKQNECNI